jgi:hypothetical protein
MRRGSNAKIISTEIPDVFTADSRAKEVELPVFSFNGITYPVTSPPWFPDSGIRLTRWELAAGSVGQGQSPSYSHFQILIGDNKQNLDGRVVANGALDGADLINGQYVPRRFSYRSSYNLDGDKGRDAPDLQAGIPFNEHVLTIGLQWIKVRCLVSCGHADVTIKIFGHYYNDGSEWGGLVWAI